MASDEELTLGAERVAADMMGTTGSILRFRLGDASDFDVPHTSGTVSIIAVANGSVTGDARDSFFARDDEPSPVIWIELDGEIVGSAGASWPDSEELVALFADRVQDAVIDARKDEGLSPAAWPECPIDRSHPLDAVVQDRTAVWACPMQPSSSSPIGSLPQQLRR